MDLEALIMKVARILGVKTGNEKDLTKMFLGQAYGGLDCHIQNLFLQYSHLLSYRKKLTLMTLDTDVIGTSLTQIDLDNMEYDKWDTVFTNPLLNPMQDAATGAYAYFDDDNKQVKLKVGDTAGVSWDDYATFHTIVKLQSGVDFDFVFRVHTFTSPSLADRVAGIYARPIIAGKNDAREEAILVCARSDSGNYVPEVYTDSNNDGEVDTLEASKSGIATKPYLRLKYDSDEGFWRAYYSTDGESWTEIGSEFGNWTYSPTTGNDIYLQIGVVAKGSDSQVLALTADQVKWYDDNSQHYNMPIGYTIKKIKRLEIDGNYIEKTTKEKSGEEADAGNLKWYVYGGKIYFTQNVLSTYTTGDIEIYAKTCIQKPTWGGDTSAPKEYLEFIAYKSAVRWVDSGFGDIISHPDYADDYAGVETAEWRMNAYNLNIVRTFLERRAEYYKKLLIDRRSSMRYAINKII